MGQTLTIRHDSTDRTSFVPGVLLVALLAAVKNPRPGLWLVFGLIAGFVLIPTSKDPSAPRLDPVALRAEINVVGYMARKPEGAEPA